MRPSVNSAAASAASVTEESVRERVGTATGKIILCGEYAMALLGAPGIAFPTQGGVTARWRERKTGGLVVIWGEKTLQPAWAMYAGQIAELCGAKIGRELHGELQIDTTLPVGKGMGSSTAMVIAIARAIIGPSCREAALEIEDAVNPGHSGMDFAVIWENRPIQFQRGVGAVPVELPQGLLKRLRLHDTGTPHESTPELVAWVRSRQGELQEPLSVIGESSHRILRGDPLDAVLRDHHRAQVKLGVVRPEAASLVARIEARGGSAKVIGAGARTGGGGMVMEIA